jgi:autotransporter-associated beta strand protein
MNKQRLKTPLSCKSHVCLVSLILFVCLIRVAKTASAATCSPVSVGQDSIIGVSCSDLSLNAAGNVTINSGVTISSTVVNTLAANFTSVSNSGTTATLTNRGTVSVDFGYGVFNPFQSRIMTLNNSGIITAASGDAINNGGFGISSASNAATIDTLNNSGSIRAGASNFGYGVRNNGVIGLLTNTGDITAGQGGNAVYSNVIGSLNNFGTIAAGDSGTGISNIGSLTTLNNSGLISAGNTSVILNISSAGTAIGNSGTTNTINNSGTISAGTGGTGISNSGTINTITNTGSIIGGLYGIRNSLSSSPGIEALNNAQGAGNQYGGLVLSGKLPTNYNVIINSPTSYGQLSGISLNRSTNKTIFNIYGNAGTTLVSGVSASTITAGTYNSVLTGLTSSNIVSSSLSGAYTGGFTWQLVNSSGTNWSLVVTSSNSAASTPASSTGVTNISSGTTVSLGNIGNIDSATLSGGTLALSVGDSSSIAVFVTSADGVIQSPSSGSATLSGALTGPGGLTFTGTGTTILTGANTYSGGTTVSSGILQGNTTSLQGAIKNNSTVIFDQSDTGLYSGAMSGTGGLAKQGDGTLVLSGVNTYSGGTTVSSGTLSVTGTTPTGTGDVVIASPATLKGTGTIAGNVIVAGTLKPGNSPGYLSVAQNVTLSTGGTYQQDIAGTTQSNSASPVGATGYYSFLTVGGQLVINSGAILAPMLQNLFQTTESGYGSVPYTPKLGDTFRIATAVSGITGTFSILTQPVGLTTETRFIPFYNYAGGNSIDLAVIPTSYATTLANSNNNTQSVAAVLDKLSAAQMSGTATSLQTNLMYLTATQKAPLLSSYAQSLTGEIYANTLAVIPQTSQRMQSAVLAHLSDTAMPLNIGNPNAGMQMSAASLTPQNPLGLPSGQFSTNPAVNPNKDIIASANNSVWGEIAYQYSHRSSDSNASGFSSNLYQAVFGADLYRENNIKAGAGFSISTTNVSMNTGSSTVNQGSLFVYGKMPVMQDYMLDGVTSVGLSSTDASRNDPTSNNSLKARGVMGNDVLLSAGLSRLFYTNDLTFTPYIRATWQMVNQSSLDEGSTSAAVLRVKSYTGNGGRGVIGLSVGSRNNDSMVDHYTYMVNIAIGADSNTLINPSLSANLAGYGTIIQTANVGNTFVQAGLYGTMKFADNAYAFAGLTGETRSGQMLGTVNVGVKVQF